MTMVSEYDIERAAWNSLDSGRSIVRNSGAKAYNVPHPQQDQPI